MVYLAAQQQQNKLIQFPVCANVGVLFTLDIRSVTGVREAHPNSISNFGFGVLHSPFQCIAVLWHRARDPISVAFFDRVALFSDFNHLFELLDQVLLSVAVVPFLYWNYAQKTFLRRSLRILWTIFMSDHTKPWSRMQSLSESLGGSKVTKPIFSNSGKRY